MEGIILTIFGYAGALSLYLVIMSVVLRGVYSKLKDGENDSDAMASAIFAGLTWPVSVPIILATIWIYAIVVGPFKGLGDESTSDEDETIKESKPKTMLKTKFKVGDLVTGVKGNPGNYQKFYEGCVCRVLEVGKNESRLKLVDHVDKEAHEKDLGRVTSIKNEHMTLIKQPKTVKKKAKKKKK